MKLLTCFLLVPFSNQSNDDILKRYGLSAQVPRYKKRKIGPSLDFNESIVFLPAGLILLVVDSPEKGQ